ncbi:hypothetical protein EBZ35_02005 [bacterium]|nr:hypothetical protein [bacterium]
MTFIGISAGEVSGDRYGALLARAIHRLAPTWQFEGMGHQAMVAAGVRCHADIAPHATIGVWDIGRALPGILGGWWRMRRWIRQTPNLRALVLIDCQGFHMPLARQANRAGIPVIYFIAPQEWQWGTESGGKEVVARTQLLLTIFKEETRFYTQLKGNVCEVGHPIYDLSGITPEMDRDAIRHARMVPGRLAVFPGSRKQEIRHTFPSLLAAAGELLGKGYVTEVVVSVASPALRAPIAALVHRMGIPVTYWDQPSETLIPTAQLSLAASGSVTLQHAVWGTPCVVAYRFGWLAYRVATWVLGSRRKKIPYMALPNLLLNQDIMPECFQDGCHGPAIARHAIRCLTDPDLQAHMAAGYQAVRDQLGTPGAIDRAAEAIVAWVNAHPPHVAG